MQDLESKAKKLTDLLKQAADAGEGASQAFFETLLDSDVWLASTGQKTDEDCPVIGLNSIENHGYISVSYSGKESILINIRNVII